ncbi:hypothetical protein K474DRAFT_524534 [Panus rudis PR-1116 ss-1]|nr:hypothetical protein K474DRAFT_524534 [Panus rudis PR-1116 ss-1]
MASNSLLQFHWKNLLSILRQTKYVIGYAYYGLLRFTVMTSWVVIIPGPRTLTNADITHLSRMRCCEMTVEPPTKNWSEGPPISSLEAILDCCKGGTTGKILLRMSHSEFQTSTEKGRIRTGYVLCGRCARYLAVIPGSLFEIDIGALFVLNLKDICCACMPR